MSISCHEQQHWSWGGRCSSRRIFEGRNSISFLDDDDDDDDNDDDDYNNSDDYDYYDDKDDNDETLTIISKQIILRCKYSTHYH